MSEVDRRGRVAVSSLGKLKTTLQMVAILVLLANPPDFTDPWVWVGYAMLYAAALLTLWSMGIYLRASWPTLRHGMEQQ